MTELQLILLAMEAASRAAELYSKLRATHLAKLTAEERVRLAAEEERMFAEPQWQVTSRP